MPRKEQEIATVATSDTAALIAAITKASRDPAVDIGKMQFLLDTGRQLMADQAQAEWRDAMAAAQADMVPINKDLSNPQTRSRYASLAALDAAIRPIYAGNGFAVTFDTEQCDEPGSIMVVAYVERGRHSRRYSIPMPTDGKGARGGEVMTKTHATGSAVTYGRRNLLCMAFNLVTSDDDGNRAGGYRAPQRTTFPDDPPPRAEHTRKAMGGLANAQMEASLGPINEKELADLKKLMTDAGVAISGEAAILNYFEVDRLEDLSHVQYEVACNQLKAKAKELKDGE